MEPGRDYDVVGEPTDVGSARALWEQDPFQFQFWAVSLLEAQPQSEQKRGADRGIDGLLYFIDGPRRTPHKVVVQVKGGHVSAPQVRDLRGVVEREQAAIGLFISLDPPTAPMRTEAASGGFFHSDLWQRDYPKIQLRTISEMLDGRGFELPPSVGDGLPGSPAGAAESGAPGSVGGGRRVARPLREPLSRSLLLMPSAGPSSVNLAQAGIQGGGVGSRVGARERREGRPFVGPFDGLRANGWDGAIQRFPRRCGTQVCNS